MNLTRTLLLQSRLPIFRLHFSDLDVKVHFAFHVVSVPVLVAYLIRISY